MITKTMPLKHGQKKFIKDLPRRISWSLVRNMLEHCRAGMKNQATFKYNCIETQSKYVSSCISQTLRSRCRTKFECKYSTANNSCVNHLHSFWAHFIKKNNNDDDDDNLTYIKSILTSGKWKSLNLFRERRPIWFLHQLSPIRYKSYKLYVKLWTQENIFKQLRIPWLAESTMYSTSLGVCFFFPCVWVEIREKDGTDQQEEKLQVS